MLPRIKTTFLQQTCCTKTSSLHVLHRIYFHGFIFFEEKLGGEISNFKNLLGELRRNEEAIKIVGNLRSFEEAYGPCSFQNGFMCSE